MYLIGNKYRFQKDGITYQANVNQISKEDLASIIENGSHDGYTITEPKTFGDNDTQWCFINPKAQELSDFNIKKVAKNFVHEDSSAVELKEITDFIM